MTVLEERAGSKPYGDVTYADPKNGKYPIDTEAHIRAAWSYINMPKNAAAYPLNGVTLESVKSKIRAAMKGIGAEIGDGDSDADDRSHHDPKWEARRRRWAGSLIRQQARRNMQMEMRARPDGTGGTTFEFEGYGAVFDAPFRMFDPWGDEYREVVRPGAFTRSLRNPDLYVPFLIGHNDAGVPLAQTANGTMRLSQDTRGLHVLAQLDGRRSDVRNLAYAVERGDMDQMSIGFVTLGQSWSDDWEQRDMLDLEIHEGDVSPVAIAANRATAGSTMTSLSRPLAERRDNPVDQNMGDSPDYNPDQGLAAAHSFTGTHSHEHTDGNGGVHDHEHSHDGDADHGHDHDGDALVMLNADGVPAMEETQGAAASLALRRRQLEILKLSGRTEVA